MTRHRPFGEKFPPNRTRERIELWESADDVDVDVIPAGTRFIEKWSNGHCSDPEVATTDLLSTDDTGSPLRYCVRRVLPLG